MRKYVVDLTFVALLIAASVSSASVVNYRFDETSGSDLLADPLSSPVAPTGNIGTIGRDSSPGYLWDTGNRLFAGSNSTPASVPAGAFGSAANGLSAFTIEFWAGNQDFWSGDYVTLINKAHGSGSSFGVTTDGGGMGLRFYWYDTTDTIRELFAGGGSIGQYSWAQYTVTYEDNGEANNFKLYRDGSVVAQTTVSLGSAMRLDDGDITFRTSGQFSFDDFRMYDSAIDVATEGGYVSQNVVPEPATMSLLALGSLSVLLRRNKK